ncbi:Golgi pH regulator B [Physocladia obscura]|uniref:Golgi pH regulator B n=1 Tax=Physocladia obscura TaxID=109957 RepID=A0AAD5SR80_9FUNG|nr:Golgi pH regulator B [Physocladia obscura]
MADIIAAAGGVVALLPIVALLAEIANGDPKSSVSNPTNSKEYNLNQSNEYIGYTEYSFQRSFWVIALVLPLVASLLVVPHAMLASCRFFRPSRVNANSNIIVNNNVNVALRVASHVLLLLVFFRLTAPSSISNSSNPHVSLPLSLLAALVSRCAVLGVALMAALSGSSAVSSPYMFLSRFVSKTTDHQVALKQKELTLTKNLITDKRSRFLLLEQDAINPSPALAAATENNPGFFRRLVSNIASASSPSSSKHSTRLKVMNSLKSDLVALDALVDTLDKDLHALIHERVRTIPNKYMTSKTLYGKFINFLGIILSVYCIYKIFTSLINLIVHKHGGTDPITLGINIAIRAFSSTDSSVVIDVEKSAQQLSFLMVGVLVVCSLRSLLVQFSKLARFGNGLSLSLSSSRRRHHSAIVSSLPNNFLALAFVEVMCIYSLSLVLMMRVNLPPRYRSIISNVLGRGMDMKFDFYQKWFDLIFLVSAGATILMIAATRDSPDDTAEDKLLMNGILQFPSKRRDGDDDGRDGLLGYAS